MYKVLIIGCGNIGALYDLNTDDVSTHVKAWSVYHEEVEISVFDTDPSLVTLITDHYSCKSVADISLETLSAFDCLSICTPTHTHPEILLNALSAGVKTIICEKPVAINEADFKALIDSYQRSESKIVVNYIRRFLPAFLNLKKMMKALRSEHPITSISIRYQRGFINNCSHAFDLLEYLFDEKLILKDVHTHHPVNDHFEYDPTLSLQGCWNDTNISVQGLSNVLYAYFEIDIFLIQHKFTIRNSGDIIEVYESAYQTGFLKPLSLNQESSQYGCLKNYMEFVINHTLLLMNGTVLVDNFLDAIDLNQRMLKYIKN